LRILNETIEGRDLERFKMGEALAELGHQIGWQ